MFHMSDDNRVYTAGRAAQQTIDAHAFDEPGLAADRDEVIRWMFSGPAWGTPAQPEPDWWCKRPARDVQFFSPGAAPDAFRPAKDATCLFE